MPYVDASTGEIVVQVVYDGLPRAGKTTNVRHLDRSLLAAREGRLESPGSPGRATVFFDWRDFRGGFVGQAPLRCRVLSVPGQDAHRRRRLLVLNQADVVVYVVSAATKSWARDRRLLDAWRLVGLSGELPLVVQLNKTDVEPDLPDARLLEALAVEAPVVRAVAHEGLGVAETLLTAMRLGRRRLDELLAVGPLPIKQGHRSATELEREMRALESD